MRKHGSIGRSLAALMTAFTATLCAASPLPATPNNAGWDERVQYLRSGGAVYGAVVTDSTGAVIRRETYVRDSSGRVLETLLKFPDGSSVRAGGLDGKEWMEFPDGKRILRTFLPRGLLETEEVRLGVVVVSRTVFRYGDYGSSPAAVIEERPTENWRREAEYGADGRLRKQTVHSASGTAETTIYERDREGRILQIRTLSGRAEFLVRFSYGEDGSVTEERKDLSGGLAIRIRTTPDGNTVEERFDDGLLFVRTVRNDGRLVREEFWTDGRIVRLRESP
ncbi:MAG TPA: hypothetical protein VLH39_07905 [Magnetospirillaceae bacterium]|nr:hypothetical protein [Magnetospirillaceae bacterium]